MRCTVLLFAQLAEALDARAIEVTVPTGATAGDVLDTLAHDHESIRIMQGQLALAVNESYATRTTLLGDGDTIALIPPVSGG